MCAIGWFIHLSNKARVTSISDVILTHITMQPVAEVDIAVIQRQNYVGDQPYKTI